MGGEMKVRRRDGVRSRHTRVPQRWPCLGRLPLLSAPFAPAEVTDRAYERGLAILQLFRMRMCVFKVVETKQQRFAAPLILRVSGY